jgi:hypothetical protein
MVEVESWFGVVQGLHVCAGRKGQIACRPGICFSATLMLFRRTTCEAFLWNTVVGKLGPLSQAIVLRYLSYFYPAFQRTAQAVNIR